MNTLLVQFEKTPINFRNAARNLGLPGFNTGTAADNFGTLVARIMNVVMAAALLLVLFYLVWGAIEWLTAGGEKGKTETARNKITNAVIGIVILSGTLAIFKFVQYLLGVEIITFI